MQVTNRSKRESCGGGAFWEIIVAKLPPGDGPRQTMRIAMFSDSYYPYVSGVTRAVATARQTLAAMGHEVALFCPAYPGAGKEPGLYRLPSFRAPTNAGYYVAAPFFAGLRRTLSSLRPDVIHIHSPFNLGKAGYTAGRRLGIPVVFTYHTMYNMYAHYVPVFGRSVSRIVEEMALQVARSVDAVVTPSGVLAEYIEARGVASPVFAIPNGIDVPEFQSGDPVFLRSVVPIPRSTPVVLTCSRLGVEKNVEVLLRSFALASGEVDAALVLIGDGPQRDALVKMASSLGIAGRTFFVGTVPPARMPDYYAGADLFLFASLTDTQGLVVVEAKAAGLPAVAVGALGVKDMVKDGEDGYLCRNDPAELAARTASLLKNPPLLASMKESAKRNAQAFSREAAAERLLDCYKSVGA